MNTSKAQRVALLLLATQLLPVSPSGAQKDATISVDEIHRGQVGYGLSVFQGTEPERFELEVVGILRDAAPDTSYILARLKGQELESTGVIAGMSGSPVYIDDRLAGAVAFGWPFANEAIAGITTIESMRELSIPSSAFPVSGTPTDYPRQLLFGEGAGEALLLKQLDGFKPALAAQASSGIQWAGVGLGERVTSLLSRTLGRLAPAGGVSHIQSELVPGSAVAAVLIDGDFRLAATGTVTDRRGDEVLAFGHPFLGVGPVDLPMATAEILTVLSSRLNSFKIANVGQVVGAIELDRQAGILGRVGKQASTIPLKISVEGEVHHEFELRLANVPSITPLLAALSTLSAVERASQAQGAQGLDLTVRIALSGHHDIVVGQAFDGEAAVIQAAIHVWSLVGYLLTNSFEEVTLEGISFELTQHGQPRMARLLEAHTTSRVVRPGETLTVNLDLQAYRGEKLRRSIKLTVPSGLAAGSYSLLVGDGLTLDLTRLALEPTDPVRFEQVVDFLNGLHSRREVVILGIQPHRGLTVAGEVLPQLPGSMRATWSASGTGNANTLAWSIVQEQVEEWAFPVAGGVRLDLEVERPGGKPRTGSAKERE